MEQENTVEITARHGVSVVSFSSAHISGVAEVDKVAGQIAEFIEKDRPESIVFDFEKVKFFSSQTLGLLVDTWKRLQEYGGKVAVSGINPQLHRVFKITNLDKIFDFYADTKTAVEKISQN